jgi:transposase
MLLLHLKTMTFVAALRHDRIEAPFVIDGPINGECFKTYVEKVLAPVLAPGDLVIMDNLGSHKGKAIRRAIRSAGAKLFFLPKYSPDLNPEPTTSQTQVMDAPESIPL